MKSECKPPKGLAIGKLYRVLADLDLFEDGQCTKFSDSILERNDLVLVTNLEFLSQTANGKRRFWVIQAISGEMIFYILIDGNKLEERLERVYEQSAT